MYNITVSYITPLNRAREAGIQESDIRGKNSCFCYRAVGPRVSQISTNFVFFTVETKILHFFKLHFFYNFYYNLFTQWTQWLYTLLLLFHLYNTYFITFLNLPLLPNTRILHYYTDGLNTSTLTQSHTQHGKKKDIFSLSVLPRQKVSVKARKYTTKALAA